MFDLHQIIHQVTYNSNSKRLVFCRECSDTIRQIYSMFRNQNQYRQNKSKSY